MEQGVQKGEGCTAQQVMTQVTSGGEGRGGPGGLSSKGADIRGSTGPRTVTCVE